MTTMSNTTYYAADDRGIRVPVTREAASRLSRAGLHVTAHTSHAQG